MSPKPTILRSQSPAALAEEYIVRSIWNNQFPAGSDLPAERELADKIGVTRTTLREVLQRLARDGWLSIQHGKATRVNNIWDTAGPSIVQTLIRLDRASAPLIISDVLSLRTRMSEYYIYEAVKLNAKACAELLQDFEQVLDNAAAFTEFDYYVFKQFTFIAQKPVYGLVFNSFKGLYSQVGKLYFSNPKGRQVTRNFYRNLLEICERGEYQKVSECIQQHREQSMSLWRNMLMDLPANFGE